MKKIILFLVFLLFATSAFAADKPEYIPPKPLLAVLELPEALTNMKPVIIKIDNINKTCFEKITPSTPIITSSTIIYPYSCDVSRFVVTGSTNDVTTQKTIYPGYLKLQYTYSNGITKFSNFHICSDTKTFGTCGKRIQEYLEKITK